MHSEGVGVSLRNMTTWFYVEWTICAVVDCGEAVCITPIGDG